MLQMSTCNIDPETGIRYGVISWWDARGLAENWLNRSVPTEKTCSCRRDCDCESDGSFYQNKEYMCHADDRGVILVLKSPYYTLCGPCSPCVPNAGDLTSIHGNLMTYCLGPEWFEAGAMPYTVRTVADRQLGVPYKRKARSVKRA